MLTLTANPIKHFKRQSRDGKNPVVQNTAILNSHTNTYLHVKGQLAVSNFLELGKGRTNYSNSVNKYVGIHITGFNGQFSFSTYDAQCILYTMR